MNVRGRDLGAFVEEARARGRRAGAEPARASRSSGAASSRTRSARWRASCWSCRWRCVITLAPAVQGVRLVLARGADRCSTCRSRSSAAWSASALAGMPLSVAAAVGFIALHRAGVAERRARALGDRRAPRGAASRSTTAIVSGRRERLRPVLMTASLAALGLVPAALSRGIGRETQRPIAVVIVGGTLSACAADAGGAAGDVPALRACHRVRAAAAARAARAARVGARPLAGRPAGARDCAGVVECGLHDA